MDEKQHERTRLELIQAAADASERFGDDECERFAEAMKARREAQERGHDDVRRQAAERGY